MTFWCNCCPTGKKKNLHTYIEPTYIWYYCKCFATCWITLCCCFVLRFFFGFSLTKGSLSYIIRKYGNSISHLPSFNWISRDPEQLYLTVIWEIFIQYILFKYSLNLTCICNIALLFRYPKIVDSNTLPLLRNYLSSTKLGQSKWI